MNFANGHVQWLEPSQALHGQVLGCPHGELFSLQCPLGPILGLSLYFEFQPQPTIKEVSSWGVKKGGKVEVTLR